MYGLYGLHGCKVTAASGKRSAMRLHVCMRCWPLFYIIGYSFCLVSGFLANIILIIHRVYRIEYDCHEYMCVYVCMRRRKITIIQKIRVVFS